LTEHAIKIESAAAGRLTAQERGVEHIIRTIDGTVGGNGCRHELPG